MRALARWVVAALALWLARRPRRRSDEPRIVAAGAPDRRAETLVLVLLGCASVSAGGFIAAALIVVAKRLVPEEELSEEYPLPEHEHEQQELLQIVEESGDRLTRRRLLKLAAVGTGGVVGAALITPAVSLGPVFDVDPLYRTPWRRGRRLVDEAGRPYRAREIRPDTFYTAYPEAQPRDDLAAPLVVVRLDPEALALPEARSGWAPGGILAYSKTCTHAACEVALYRTPLFAPTAPRPALVCPCHYSTFDPATGGTVLFGPAGRPLPQLPLLVDERGHLRAAGGFSGPVGPSWWGVRMRA